MTARRGPGRPLPRLVAFAAALAMAGPLIVAAEPAAGTDAGSIVGRVRVSPVTVVLTLSTGSVQVGQGLKAEALVTNIGASTLRGMTIELRADHDGLVLKSPIVSLGQLKPGKSTTIGWSVCGNAVGSYVLLARVTEAGEPVDSIARLLSVTPGGRKSCS